MAPVAIDFFASPNFYQLPDLNINLCNQKLVLDKQIFIITIMDIMDICNNKKDEIIENVPTGRGGVYNKHIKYFPF